MTEIGKIERPEAARFRDKKKIYFVRNLYVPQNASDRYREIISRYWKEVEEHLEKLEAAGKVAKIFCESIYMAGDDAMKVLSAMNVQLEQLVKKMIDAGGEFLPLENKDIFGAYIDWNNCLMVVRTSKVYDAIRTFLEEAAKERFSHIKSVLDQNIAESEAALLIMREEDRKALDLPDDTELFFVTPPAYDDLQRFLSDRDSGTEYWRT